MICRPTTFIGNFAHAFAVTGRFPYALSSHMFNIFKLIQKDRVRCECKKRRGNRPMVDDQWSGMRFVFPIKSLLINVIIVSSDLHEATTYSLDFI